MVIILDISLDAVSRLFLLKRRHGKKLEKLRLVLKDLCSRLFLENKSCVLSLGLAFGIIEEKNKRCIPSFRLVGGFRVAQLVRIDLEPSHCPFIRAIAFSASTFFVKETNPYPFDLRVCGSRTTRQSL